VASSERESEKGKITLTCDFTVRESKLSGRAETSTANSVFLGNFSPPSRTPEKRDRHEKEKKKKREKKMLEEKLREKVCCEVCWLSYRDRV